MKFCQKLRLLIEENNLTQKQVAIDLHISPSTMGGYVQGVSEPDFETLRMISHYFRVSADYLLDIDSVNGNSPLDSELLRVFHGMPEVYREIFIEQGKAFLKKLPK